MYRNRGQLEVSITLLDSYLITLPAAEKTYFCSGSLLLCFPYIPSPPRYLLYRVLEPLGPYIVGTWEVRI